MIKRNEIDEITISIPADNLTETEQMTLLTVYVREKSSQTNHSVLPTAINTDDEKVNFTYNIADSVSADIHDAVELFTGVTMKLCEKAKREAKVEPKQAPDYQPASLPTLTLLKIHSQILTIHTTGKYNMFDTSAVQREAYELGFYELVIFIKEHKADYAHFILTGDLPGLPLSLYPLEGSEVVLGEMPEDPNPVPSGTVGTVKGYDDSAEILMSWQNGSGLKLIPGVDRYHVVEWLHNTIKSLHNLTLFPQKMTCYSGWRVVT